jgi:hypothetical protein
LQLVLQLTLSVCVSDALVAEIKRIVKESEILKYVKNYMLALLRLLIHGREDDTKWPQKNKDGRQELEIRLGSEHISFEVYLCKPAADDGSMLTGPDCEDWLAARRAGLV